jgi:hypothetical protein
MKKRMHDNSRVTELFIKAGLIAALAATVLMPTTVKVHSHDPRVERGWPMPERGSTEALPLPPIRYLETMPWLIGERVPKGTLKIDPLLAPKFEMAPAVAGAADDGTPSWAFELEHSLRG